MVMKLIDLELAMTGLSRRTEILTKIETVLKQDWGTLEDINQRNTAPEMKNTYQAKLADLKQRYKDLS
jgi:DNA sulfur modification protein DndC